MGSYKPRRLPGLPGGFHAGEGRKPLPTLREEIDMFFEDARLEPPDVYGGDGYDCEDCSEPYADERLLHGTHYILCDERLDDMLREDAIERAIDDAREARYE